MSAVADHLYERMGYHTVWHEKYPVENGAVLSYEVIKKAVM